jgi:gamma-glutamyltranspeptidase/glutathione hydrolase
VRDDDALTALARPRLHHQWMPETLHVEAEYPAALVESLKKFGHKTATRDAVANVQLIRRAKAPQTGWDAASDPRKGGEPAGE